MSESAKAPTGPGPYTIQNLLHTTFRFLPGLVEHVGTLAGTFAGSDPLAMDVRIALHLRLARVMRCPVCLMTFPAVARVVGLSGPEIDAALEGRTDRLRPDVARTVAWAAAVAAARGEMPLDWPEEARDMSMPERERIMVLTRLELLVHSVGLVVVPEPLLGSRGEGGGITGPSGVVGDQEDKAAEQ